MAELDELDELQARVAGLTAEHAEAMAILEPGAEQLGDGTPVPTSLTTRARNVAMALSAEAEEANRLNDEVGRLRKDVEVLTAANARLTHILAAERGERGRDGWSFDGSAWARDACAVVVMRFICRRSKRPFWSRARGVDSDGPPLWEPVGPRYDHALLALDAIDAERGVSNAD